jgi:hypothetical protein
VIFVTGTDVPLSLQQQTQLRDVARLRKPYDPLDPIDELHACVR